MSLRATPEGSSTRSDADRRRRLLTASILLGIFAVLASSTSVDPNDTWWHIRSGEYYLEHGTVPSVDVFSHTVAGQQYFPHEWLSQVILYLTYQGLGFVGIRLLNTLMAVVSILLLWRFFRGATERLLPVLFAIAVIFPDVLSRLNTRPEIFTLPLFIAFLHFVLHRDRSRLPGWKPLVVVAVMAAVWANLHGMALLGLIYLIAYTAGQTVAHLGRRFLRVSEWHAVTTTGILGDLILIGVYGVAVLATPMGYRIYVHAFEARQFLPGPLGIMEWLSPFQFLGGILHSFLTREFPWINVALAWQFLFLALPLLYFFALPVLALRRRLPQLGEILVVMLAIYQAATVVRFRWLFFILLFYIIRAIAAPRSARGSEAEEPPSPLSAIVLSPLMILIIASSMYVTLTRGISFRSAIDTDRYPVGIANFLEDAGLDGDLFNSYNWGGYLLFRLSPANRVFIDGRTDLYAFSNRNLMLDHVAIESKQEGYQELLDIYDVDILVASGRIYFPGSEYSEELDFERGQAMRRLAGARGDSPDAEGPTASEKDAGSADDGSPDEASLWIPVLVNREGSIYLRNTPRHRERMGTLREFFAAEQIPFTPEDGPDLASIIRLRPRLAVRYGILSDEVIRGVIGSVDDPESDEGIEDSIEFATALINLEFFRDGVAILEDVLKIDRYNNNALMQVAFALHLLGENDRAYAHLERSATVGRNRTAFQFIEHCRRHRTPPSERPPRLPSLPELAAEWRSSYLP